MLFNPSHPGEVLKDYLGDMTVKEAARRLGVTRPNLSRILDGRAGISAVMSVRLAKAMPYTSPEFWLKAGANLDNGDPEMLLYSMTRFFKFLPAEQRQAFLGDLSEKAS
jgi:addiction module HigA family antidote